MVYFLGKSCGSDDGGRPTDVIRKGCRPPIEGPHTSRVAREERRTDATVTKTAELLRRVRNKPHTSFAGQVRFFLLAIALCHTCHPEKGADGKTTFQAASPDEVALLRAAQDLGYEVLDWQSDSITISICLERPDSSPVQETYEILDVLEFSSARRRMSVVVRMPDQRICVFGKGADTVIQQRVRLSGPTNEVGVELLARSLGHSASQHEHIDQAVREALEVDEGAVLEVSPTCQGFCYRGFANPSLCIQIRRRSGLCGLGMNLPGSDEQSGQPSITHRTCW